jgi:hypothetical protein
MEANNTQRENHHNGDDAYALGRPKTPHIDVIEIKEFKKLNSSTLIRNFSSLIGQIIDNTNENFLNGNINVIEYLISKYTGVSINEVRGIEKFSIKIQTDLALLNIIAEYLPILKELKLNNSRIPEITDLGTNFSNITTLHVNSCQLQDLSGIYIAYYRYIMFPEPRGP